MTEYNYDISYGKIHVPLYRVYATPLKSIRSIPESSFTGRENTLFALEVDVEVFGENFLPAYTIGDNRNVVATDSMKNFVLRHALSFQGSTLEGFLHYLGRAFLDTYPQMERLRLTGRELPFETVPIAEQNTITPSEILFKRSHNDATLATLDFIRTDNTIEISNHQCGRVNLELLKVTGSSFTRFVHDAYTTLPERTDRPLFIYLDVYWRYTDISALPGSELTHYVPAEQVRDVVQVVFHQFVSESIQHLVHEMGTRLLSRFPQLAEVSFSAQNRTKDPLVVSETDERQKVYSEPFPAYGIIKLKLSRNT